MKLRSLPASAHLGHSDTTSFALDGFSVQYTSLILIVLSFVIGAFVGDKLTAIRAEAPEVLESLQRIVAEQRPREVLLSQLHEEHLFDALAETPRREALSAIATLLQSHDLTLRGTIGVGQDEPINPPEALTLAMSRTSAVEHALRELGAPPDSFRLYAVEEMQPYQAMLEVVRNDR